MFQQDDFDGLPEQQSIQKQRFGVASRLKNIHEEQGKRTMRAHSTFSKHANTEWDACLALARNRELCDHPGMPA